MPMPVAAPPPVVACSVETRSGADGVEFHGSVSVQAPVDGAYQLVITKKSAAGSASVKQKGLFSARPGQVVRLGQAAFNHEPSVFFDVRLRLDIAGQEIVCSEYTGGSK